MSLVETHPYYQLDWVAMPKHERDQRRELSQAWAEATVKPGDVLFVARCGGRSRFTVARWDGKWIESKSGANDISPLCILRINGRDASNPGHKEKLV